MCESESGWDYRAGQQVDHAILHRSVPGDLAACSSDFSSLAPGIEQTRASSIGWANGVRDRRQRGIGLLRRNDPVAAEDLPQADQGLKGSRFVRAVAGCP